MHIVLRSNNHCIHISFFLYKIFPVFKNHFPYSVETSGLDEKIAATILTSPIPIPKLKNKLAIPPLKPTKIKHFKSLLFGKQKDSFIIFILMAPQIIIPDSIIREVRTGPNIVTGILITQ